MENVNGNIYIYYASSFFIGELVRKQERALTCAQISQTTCHEALFCLFSVYHGLILLQSMMKMNKYKNETKTQRHTNINPKFAINRFK